VSCVTSGDRFVQLITMTLSILRNVTVIQKDGCGGQPWVAQVIVAGGVEFVKLDKRCQGFRKFMGGEINAGAYAYLRSVSKAKADEEVRSLEASNLFAPEHDMKVKRRKVNKATPSSVLVTVGDFTFKAFAPTRQNGIVCVELTTETLEWVREFLHHKFLQLCRPLLPAADEELQQDHANDAPASADDLAELRT
jgi:hypothetical protein